MQEQDAGENSQPDFGDELPPEEDENEEYDPDVEDFDPELSDEEEGAGDTTDEVVYDAETQALVDGEIINFYSLLICRNFLLHCSALFWERVDNTKILIEKLFLPSWGLLVARNLAFR